MPPPRRLPTYKVRQFSEARFNHRVRVLAESDEATDALFAQAVEAKAWPEHHTREWFEAYTHESISESRWRTWLARRLVEQTGLTAQH